MKKFIQNTHQDIQNILKKDPAAKNKWQVLLCYPSIHAISMHRLAHYFYHQKYYVLAGLIAAFARFLTGIEIHPGATIGQGVFIDHGMGVVIGETAIVGDYCTIYQGVTLGGTSLEAIKRHPTLEQSVTVSSGAKVLGNITIHAYAKIGANAVVLNDVEAGQIAVGVPAKVLNKNNKINKINENKSAIQYQNEVFSPYCAEKTSPVDELLKNLKTQIDDQQRQIEELQKKLK